MRIDDNWYKQECFFFFEIGEWGVGGGLSQSTAKRTTKTVFHIVKYYE